MCGFIGVISKNDIQNNLINKCDEYLSCRGPDEQKAVQKYLKKSSNNIVFSFHRLSILDLSEKASQPMEINKESTILMFNGEIYNCSQLRDEMENKNIHFNTFHSDTETLLNGLTYFGNEFINKLEGQFAFAFLDERKNSLILVRDRVGQKPLYFFRSNNEIIFGSNFKSILKYKQSFDIDKKQIINFLNFGVIPSPHTLDQHIQKVLPGQLIEFSLDDLSKISEYKYWDILDYVGDDDFNENTFFDLFNSAVKKRMIADVPIATLLSGGLDSTSIVKSISENKTNNEEVVTFNVKNLNSKYDESFWAELVSKKYSTTNKTAIIDGKNLFDNPLKVLKELDEPYADPSIIPSYLIYKLISENYKVAISGDGGDELLGGYEKIHLSLKKSNTMFKFIENLYNVYPPFLGTGSNILKYSKSIENKFIAYTIDKKFLEFLSLKEDQNFGESYMNSDISNLKKLMLSDYNFYLSEMMLYKVDRTAMANSLEIRSPFVDHKLIEYIFSTNMSFHNIDNPKQLLKNKLSYDFDKKFLNRKKMGFVFDLENWIYSNKEELLSIIKKLDFIDLINVRKLFLFKSRINSLRIFKLLVISEFIEDYKLIANN